MKLRIIPLGGFEEVGKNCLALELLPAGQKKGDIMVIDMGLDFPGPNLLGVDYVLPDVDFLKKNKERIKGLVITHGHLDHIGALPYFINQLGNPPIYATPLTIGLIEDRFLELGFQDAKFKVIKPEEKFSIGAFSLLPFAVVHNIPDSVGFIIKTPLGSIVHTGDFKFDKTPADQKPVNEKLLKKVGDEGVLLLMSDSTNAAVPGEVVSEKEVGEMISSLIKGIKGRIIFTTFASLISRIQQAIDVCQKCKRKVALIGLSVQKTVAIAQGLGYLKIPPKMLIDITDIKKFPPHKVFIIAGGSQGMEGSSMERIAQNVHRLVRIKSGDTVIFSSSTVPGNEIAVSSVMNGLVDQGAEIIFRKALGSGIHSSGHAQQEDLLKMMSLIRPRFFVPIEGAHYMQAEHIKLAQKFGIKKKNCFMLKNGEVLEINERKEIKKDSSFRASHNMVVVEGSRTEVLNEQILEERQRLAENGICFVSFVSSHSFSRKSEKKKSKNKEERVKISSQGIALNEELVSELKKKASRLFKRHGLRPGSGQKIAHSLSDSILSRIGKKPKVIVSF
ncbi:ribonuclease J [Patescibacteria group bacterium]|nr:ribonuclease J [Patescibacteria group bacterium]